ncbi:hypothetical protein A6A25_30715 [Saccharothrix sp. CB00851]|nr:hypothetical protein A6A25_30715 [Saccharothrix sp. CB00851]
MNRGILSGDFGESPGPRRLWPGTSSHCQAAVSRKSWPSPEARWMRETTPGGFAGAFGGFLGDVLEPGQAVVAGDLGEGLDPGVVLAEPVAETADRQLQFVHRGGPVGQSAGGQPLVGDSLHGGRQHQGRLPPGHQACGVAQRPGRGG